MLRTRARTVLTLKDSQASHTGHEPVPPIIPPEDRLPRQRVPLKVWIGLFIAVGLDGPVQLVWKALMMKYGDPARGPHLIDVFHEFRWFTHQARTWLLLGLFICQFIDWMWVLGNADLSYAQPFTALSYVVVSTCAAIFFHEHLSTMRIAGILLILIGVMLVGGTEHRTTRPTPAGGEQP
jgi:drug/metabolite transporter (DMT)-like permease